MRILTVISRLLDYPDPQLWQYRDELMDEIKHHGGCLPDNGEALLTFVSTLTERDILDAQEDYIGLFDRGRSLSLLLFEHVHGDSRDRGQAMVDLMALYQRHGFSISVRELPDYIPLFLEFLASRPQTDVLEWLGDAGHILALLAMRLHERKSLYAVLFDALVAVGQIEVDTGALRNTVKDEARDDTPEAMDAIWEEEATRFGAAPGDGCNVQKPLPTETQAAVKWVQGANQRISL